MTVTPIDDTLFAEGGQECVLLASRCRGCAAVAFPRAASCSRCQGRDVADHPLPTQGRVWSWTVQNFEPKPPYRAPADGFLPFAVGYVDLGAVLVEAILVPAGGPDQSMAIGDTARLTWHPVPGDEGTVHTYAFEVGA